MHNEFKERLKSKRLQLNLSQTDIATSLGVKPQSVNQWERGISVPRGHRIDALASILNTRVEWLLLGINRGEEATPGTDKLIESSLFDKESNLSSSSLGYDPGHSFVDIPVYDISLAAGAGCYDDNVELIETYPISTLLLSKHNLHSSNTVIGTVSGESMEPTLCNKDLVLINRAITMPISNKIFAFVFDGSLRVKRFTHKLDRSWAIISDNDDKNRYQDETISSASVRQLDIIGQVVTIVERSLL
jgi:phage repressor protein C with HTH and peptisase S24 domain